MSSNATKDQLSAPGSAAAKNAAAEASYCPKLTTNSSSNYNLNASQEIILR